MSEPMLDFVVCTRNNRDIIGATMDAIAAQSCSDWTCTAVDGCSTDGTAAFLRDQYDWVKVIEKSSDSGPPASRNLGARQGKAKYIAFVDSDVRLDPAWAESQIGLLESSPHIGAAGGKLLYANRPEVLNSAYGTSTRFGIAANVGDGEPACKYGELTPCLWVMSAAMIVRRDIFERSGGFDEAMFFLFEDADLGWHINLFGFRVMYNPAAVAFHRAHSTVNRNTQQLSHIKYLLYRNRLRCALVNYEAVNILRYTSVYLLLSLAEIPFRDYRAAKLAALFWNMANLKSTLDRRRHVQHQRQVRDRELWHLFIPGMRDPKRFMWDVCVAAPSSYPAAAQKAKNASIE